MLLGTYGIIYKILNTHIIRTSVWQAIALGLTLSIPVNRNIHGVLQALFHGISTLSVIEDNVSLHIIIQSVHILDLLFWMRIIHGYMLLHWHRVGH